MSMTKPACSWMATRARKPVVVYLAVAFLATGLEAIDLDCLLHPVTISDTSSGTCPTTPKRTVRVYYECEECGVFGPLHNALNVGYGECGSSGLVCNPWLDSITYRFASVAIRMVNNRIEGSLCVGSLSTVTRYCQCPGCDPSPIIISLGDGALQLTGPEDGVSFDLTADGIPENTAWTEADGDDAFLALDRNQNEFIDDGLELFGDSTPQPITDPAERNGFAALAVFDDSLSGGNENGFIDPDDAIFSDLQLWIDSNHNGISEAGELQSLSEAGVEAIDLDYKRSSRKDAHGNEFRFKSKVHLDRGVRMAWDVFFKQLPVDPVDATTSSASSRSKAPSCRQPEKHKDGVRSSAPR